MTDKPKAKPKSKLKPKPSNLWVKGQSGNPGGRPKMPEDLKKALACAAPDAVRWLVDYYQNPKNDDKVRFRCVEKIIEMAYGKTPQPIFGDINTTLKIVVLDANAKIEDGVIDV